jgi:hypothetical protein
MKLRRNNLALVYGDWQILHESDTELLVKRTSFDTAAIIALNKSNKSAELTLPNLSDKAFAHFGNRITASQTESTLSLQPYSFEIITTPN